MPRLFSTPVLRAKLGKIDRENGIIHDVVLCRVGEARGHELWINDRFIQDLVKLGNEHGPGVKCRFGHPNMCSEALGTYLGRFKNFRKTGEQAIGDLYLDDVAKKSPNGDLYTYVLDMAEKNPDMFGNSIVFNFSDSEELTVEIPGSDDGKVKPLTETRTFPIINELFGSDLVDDPAATDGMFTKNMTSAQVTEFLDSHPEVFELMDKNPELLPGFIERYKSYKSINNKSLSMKTKDAWTAILAFFGADKKELNEADVEALNNELQAKNNKVNDLTQQLQSANQAKDAAEKKAGDLETEKAGLSKKVSDLETEVTELKKGKPAGKPSKVNGEGGSNDDENNFSASVATARELFQSVKD